MSVNKLLFNKIKEQVMAEPKSLSMRFFCRFLPKSVTNEHNCGTVGCIGGWAMLLMGLKKPLKAYKDWENREDSSPEVPSINEDQVAAALLGIPMTEARLLFYFYAHFGAFVNSDHPYQALADKLTHHREGSVNYAKVVCEAIDLCIFRGEQGLFAND